MIIEMFLNFALINLAIRWKLISTGFGDGSPEVTQTSEITHNILWQNFVKKGGKLAQFWSC